MKYGERGVFLLACMRNYRSLRLMRVWRKILSSVVLMGLVWQVSGQVDSARLILIRGQLMNSSTLKPVGHAHVMNINRNLAAVSDTLGKFTIRMKITDTLLITAIGFERRFYNLPAFVTSTTYYPKIYIRETVYPISKVEISSLGNYSQFRDKVSELNIPETREEKLRRETIEQAREAAIASYQIPTGISFHIPSKSDISWKKVQELQEIEKRQMILYSKYNREVIARTSRLRGELLDEFIMFCNQRSWFTPETSAYDIIYQIKVWYKQFMAMKGYGTKSRRQT